MNFSHIRGMLKISKLLLLNFCSREFFFIFVIREIKFSQNHTFILDYVFYPFLQFSSQRVELKSTMITRFLTFKQLITIVQFKYYITILDLTNFNQFRNLWSFDGFGRANILWSDGRFRWCLSFFNCLCPTFNFISFKLSSIAEKQQIGSV